MTEPTGYTTIIFFEDSGIANVTLNRPAVLNAVNEEMGIELLDALKRVEHDPRIRCVTVTGSGRAFCAGEDIQALRVQYEKSEDPRLGERLVTKYNPIVTKICEIEKPFIAAVNGVAAGAGASLAYACDLRIASTNASFVQAFVRVGLAPDSGSSLFLPRLVGVGKAMEMSLLGEPIAAEEALRLGLVSKVVPVEQLSSETRQMAIKLANGPSIALALTKRALNKTSLGELAGALEYESHLQAIAGRTRDHREAVRAFFEKRTPTFKGS